MKTFEQIIEAVKNEKTWSREACDMLDNRDLGRLGPYASLEQLEELGFTAKDPSTWEPLPFTLENVLQDLGSSLDFAFEKAINHRGISSELMFNVIQMYMWILEDNLSSFMEYEPYGMLLYQAVAEKYGFPDRSAEYKEEE